MAGWMMVVCAIVLPANLLPAQPADSAATTARFSLIAVGDVNLGRSVGRTLLGGDTLYPFVAVRDTFAAYDLVIANLESQVSDQGGRTEHPSNNLVFTAPPAAASSLQRAGVHLVSTANNHALDFGTSALTETIGHLRTAGIVYAGTASTPESLFVPALITRNGVRVAFFAVTDIMNSTGGSWKKWVAPADSGKLYPAIRRIRDSVDVVIVSIHGGEEYSDRPGTRVRSFAMGAVDAGARIVLGHHPHVSYGLEEYHGALIVPSLGNFVFRQPQRRWTQLSIAVRLDVIREGSTVRLAGVRPLPVQCGFQPSFLPPGDDARLILERTQQLSQIGSTAWTLTQ